MHRPVIIGSTVLCALLVVGVPAAIADTAAGGALSARTAPLEIVVDRDPSRVAAARQLARLHAEGGNWDAAWRVLERSQPHAGKDAVYQGLTGTVLRRLQRSSDAAAAYWRAIALQPQEARWWVGLGLALDDAGRRREARDAFANAYELGEALPPVLLKLAERRSR